MTEALPPQSSSARPWREHLAALAIFVLVIVIVFHGAIFRGEVLASVDLLAKEWPWRAVLQSPSHIDNYTQLDVFSVFHPWKYFVHDELQAGRFPLWCRYVGCGYPVAGNGIIKLFGLTTACLWIAPPRIAAVLTFSLQLFIAMAGVYTLLRALRVRWLGAIFGALLFGLASPTFQHLEFEHIVGGLMMLPWICWALWHASLEERNSLRWTALGGLFFGFAIINGSIQSAAIVGMSAAGFGFASFRGEHRWKRAFVALCLLAALGIVVGAVALLPNLELFRLNERQRFDRIDWWQLTWKRPLVLLPWLAGLANPDALGNYQTFDLMRALGSMGTAATAPATSDVRTYCGLAALVLAWFGLRSSQPGRRLGLWLVATPLVLAVLTPLYLILYFRVFAACSLGVALLAGLGLERLLERDEKLKHDAAIFIGILAVACALALAVGATVSAKRGVLTHKCEKIGRNHNSVYQADQEWQRQKARNTVNNFSLCGPFVVRFCLFAGVVGIVLLVARRKPLAAAFLLLVVNTADLVEFAWRTMPSVPAVYEYPQTPGLTFLQQQTGLFRVMSSWNGGTQLPTLNPNTLIPYHLDDPRIYESLFPANPLLNREDWNALNVRFFAVQPGSKPPCGNWRRVYHDDLDIYENPDVWPRVYFTTNLTHATPVTATVSVRNYASGDVRVDVEAPSAGWLVLAELEYPGWKAMVNHTPGTIIQANKQWIAVAIHSGKNAVRFVYQPASVHGGVILSILGLALVFVIAVYGKWNRNFNKSNIHH